MSDGMNLALRELCNADSSSGEGPIQVLMKQKDFNVVEVQAPDGRPMSAPADSLIAFTAHAFRELKDGSDLSGVWEFRVDLPMKKEGAPPAQARMFVCGEDILTVRTPSKVLG